LPISQEALADFCRKHEIEELSLFGSALRDDFGPHSDVDLLVRFQQSARPTLLTIAGMELELAGLIGRKVDLRTPNELSPEYRAAIIRGARLLYSA
jgi:predicted nucleotidyltransferase